jgi:thioredoxin reductase
LLGLTGEEADARTHVPVAPKELLKMSTQVLSSTDANQQVQAWLSSFEESVRTSDFDAIAAHFAPDGHWRDLVALTWHVHTFSGRAQVRAALEEFVPTSQPSAFEIDPSVPPRQATRDGIDTVEMLFTFKTGVGSGNGVVRLVHDDDGRPRALVLLTALKELTGFEPATGRRRPRGEQYSRNFGGPNWLDKRLAAIEYQDRSPQVLVVGGGQAGLAIAARLNVLSVNTLVVDRMDRIGDNWRNRYHSLTLHNEVWVNHLPYMPFPDTWPVYVPKDKLAGWFEAYAEAMEINFWTSTEFLGGAYDETENRWTVRVRRNGQERTLQPHHIVLATGVSGIPSIPPIPGLDDFAGTVIHSSAHTSGTDHAGKRALVIGTGNSGHDVAQDLYSSGAEVTMIQRGSTTVVDVESAQKVYALYSEGLPTETCDLISLATPYPHLRRFYQLATKEMVDADKDLIDGLNQIGFRTDLGDEDTGFQLKYLERGGGYYLNVGCSDLMIAGEIGLLQYEEVERLIPSGTLLRDGREVPAELIILATGYKPQQEQVRLLFGDAIADRVGTIWGFDEHGELRNMWKRTPQPGLWFLAGSLAQARNFSKYLAIQIKAIQEGLIDPTKPPSPAAYQQPNHLQVAISDADHPIELAQSKQDALQ